MTDKQKHRFYIEKYSSETKSLNGVFIECGVKYGTTSAIVAKTTNKNGYLFDTWNKFEGLTSEDGSENHIKRIRKRNLKPIKKLCINALKKKGVYSLCKMIQGNVLKTVPQFLDKNPDLNIVFLHLDLDVYLPTKLCLELLWDKIVDNGIVFIHDYGSRKWKGIKKCVDEFCMTNKIEINKLDIEACVLKK